MVRKTIRKKLHVENEKNSVKTVIFFCIIVLFFIIVSLALKAYSLLKESLYDGKHQFTIAIQDKSGNEEIVSFDPINRGNTVLEVQGDKDFSKIAQELGVAVDARIITTDSLRMNEASISQFDHLLWHFPLLKTRLTVFDLAHLAFLARTIPQNKLQTQAITLPKDQSSIDKFISALFVDQNFLPENISIQIINETGQSGFAKRLERIIINTGGNVVSVTSSPNIEKKSQIIYYNKLSYTVERIENFLHFPLRETNDKGVADITIILGEDSVQTVAF